MDGIILSFQLFTRIPLKKNVDFNEKNLKVALYILPLIGGLIGVFTGVVLKFFNDKSNFLGGAFGLLAYFFISGGLHLDGLSDTIDGFLSNRDRKKTLEIMKDSLIGTFGTLALITYSFLKFSLYGTLTKDTIVTLVLVSFLSRLSAIWIIFRGRLARPGGFGSKMRESIGEDYKLLILYLVLGLIITYFYNRFLIGLVSVILVSEIINYISLKKIGGVTGDVYGATIEVNEIVGLVILGGILWI